MTASLPLYLFLYIYLALVFVSLLYILFNFYHLFRFGSLDKTTVSASFIFFAVLAVIFFASYLEIEKINWRQPLISLYLPVEVIESIQSILPKLDLIKLPVDLEEPQLNDFNNFDQDQ